MLCRSIFLHDRADGTALAGLFTNLWPSKFSPRNATKRSPGCTVRESVLMRDDAFGEAVLPDGSGEMRDLFNRERVHVQCVPPSLLLRA